MDDQAELHGRTAACSAEEEVFWRNFAHSHPDIDVAEFRQRCATPDATIDADIEFVSGHKCSYFGPDFDFHCPTHGKLFFLPYMLALTLTEDRVCPGCGLTIGATQPTSRSA